jgi:carbon monoxide dehydrogenase subunit G
MRIENSFTVPAPIERAWDILIDVARIAPCMPGAEITETIDPRHFKGRAQVKVGPVALAFQGEASLEELDPAARRARVKARGSDTKGRGGAEAELVFRLVPEGNATKVEITADVQMSGAVAQYGRAQGLIKEIAAQLTKEFASNLARQMASSPAPAPAAATGAASAPMPTAPAPVKPVSGLGLLWKALASLLARWLGRQ